MHQEFSIDNQRFTLLGMQRGGAAVYRGDAGAYLRLGSREIITRDVALHKAMVRAKFPVAPLIAEGELGSQLYFIEKSLGTRSFRVIFQEDTEHAGEISNTSFLTFLSVVKKLYSAQVKAAGGSWNVDEFAEGVQLPLLMHELQSHASEISSRFQKAVSRMQKAPSVLTHGDCNPSNIYNDGIIDLEDSFQGPLGYDVISALVSIDWSPYTRDHEFFAQYRFSDEQKTTYLQMFRTIALRSQKIDITEYVDDLAFCRAIWLCSGMGEWPRLQQWRYEKFVKEYLT